MTPPSYYCHGGLPQEIPPEPESPLLNDLLDVSDSRNYTLYRRAFNRMAQILGV